MSAGESNPAFDASPEHLTHAGAGPNRPGPNEGPDPSGHNKPMPPPGPPPPTVDVVGGNALTTKPSVNPEKGQDQDVEEDQPERAMWGNQIEFLMSCIATSVGLGNVWRFPYVAYQNGGGAFLIPYVIVLFLIGKPMYYLECALGQFSSRNSVKIWSMVPAMKGTGYSQAMCCGYILSYYVSIIALCMYYLVMSFQAQLPWGECKQEWLDEGIACIPSSPVPGAPAGPPAPVEDAVSSAELYFVKTVLRQKDGIEGGIGLPIWDLTLCLFAAWAIIFVIVARGVKSSGKAAYFLALFPYVVMIILLIRAATLEGAGDGILFFLTPQWEMLIKLEVWYAAVTQVFFSLSVSTGAIIMFSSYNGFRQNIYRDAMIVTTLDTFTSLMSGITIFGILGNLAVQLGRDDINDVIGAAGTGVAFISYPDAIAKSPLAPQLFAVLFFLMMTVLGVGSGVALMSTINTVMMDAFPKVPTVVMSASCCLVGFAIGLFYVTPGGQYILELVDYYGGTFLVLFAAIAEIVGVFWIYGLENVCTDIEFMLGIKTSVYWRFCWGLITPLMMISVFIYALQSFEALKFADVYVYPTAGYVAGYIMLLVGVMLVPLLIITTLHKYWTGDFIATVKKAFSQKKSWAPRNNNDKKDWIIYKQEAQLEREKFNASWSRHIWLSLTGGYRNKL